MTGCNSQICSVAMQNRDGDNALDVSYHLLEHKETDDKMTFIPLNYILIMRNKLNYSIKNLLINEKYDGVNFYGKENITCGR